jgi:serine protease AprX
MSRFCPSLRLLLLAVFVLTVAFASASAAPRDTTQRVHAAVWQYRDAHPGADIPVIVQTSGASDPVDVVHAFGGTVGAPLGIIHGVSAMVPADQLEVLSSSADVRWVSLDAPIASTDYGGDGGHNGGPDGKPKNDPPAGPDAGPGDKPKSDPSAGRDAGAGGDSKNKTVADTGTAPASVYPQAIRADKAWKDGDFGQGVGIAIVDTGIAASSDFNGDHGSRVVATVSRDNSTVDGYGHGSHVAGLAAGNGVNSGSKYIGVAPAANLINVKVGADDGSATVSDIINGLQFVLDNQDTYNIRVVNLSLRSDTAESYLTDPLDAAVELVTFRGILVVVAAGNTGTDADAVSYAPANDPFVLSVGAVDDAGTSDTKDDTIPAWSSRGVTQDGFSKPDLYTPGRRLISVLSPGSALAQEFPNNVIGSGYFQLSGTSMAAGVASGAAALVFKAHPDWTPGQVKLALAQSGSGVPGDSGAKFAQVDRAIHLNKPPVDTTLDILPNDLLLQTAADADPSVTFDKISWSKISWSKISWSKISWSKISWGSVSWSKISWGTVDE